MNAPIYVVDSVNELLRMVPHVDPIGMILMGFSEPAMLRFASENRVVVPSSGIHMQDAFERVRDMYFRRVINAFRNYIPIRPVYDKKTNKQVGFRVGYTIELRFAKSGGNYPTVTVLSCSSKPPNVSDVVVMGGEDTGCNVISADFLLGPDVDGTNNDAGTPFSTTFVWDDSVQPLLEAKGYKVYLVPELKSLVENIRSSIDEATLNARLMRMRGMLFRALVVQAPPFFAFPSSIDIVVSEKRITVRYVGVMYINDELRAEVEDVLPKLIQILDREEQRAAVLLSSLLTFRSAKQNT